MATQQSTTKAGSGLPYQDKINAALENLRQAVFEAIRDKHITTPPRGLKEGDSAFVGIRYYPFKTKMKIEDRLEVVNEFPEFKK